MENTLSLKHILEKIMIDIRKTEEKLVNNEVEVIISSYSHIKEYLSFELDAGSKEPLVERIYGMVFYIYDDFYDNKEYDTHYHIFIDLPNGGFRVDYKINIDIDNKGGNS